MRVERSFHATLGLTVLGAVVPGSGFLASGRRALGLLVLGVVGLCLLGGVGALAYESNLTMLGAELAARPSILHVLGFVALALGLGWVIVIVASHLMVRPTTASWWQRGAGIGLVLVLCAAVLTPSVYTAETAWATRDFVEKAFPSVPGDPNVPSGGIDEEDPWAGTPRLNVLLLGADSGDNREGLRTDTMIVASIDTRSGDTVLFSLPRNLQDVPFPRKNPLHDIWPNGYKGGSGSSTLMLNGVYREADENYPDLFPGDPDPGMTTLRGVVGEVTGLEIDYHVLVNLEGFERFVDALGGIDIDVGPERVPIGGLDFYGNPQPDSRIEEWIPAGQQHLDGYQALWFARDRRDSDDYMRMRRQRCVINALVEEATPTNVLTNYLELAATAEDTIRTDVPRQMLPAMVELAERVRSQPVRTLPFTDDVIVTADPDFRLIRQLVRTSLEPPASTTPPPSSEPTTVPSADPTESATPTPTPDPTVAVLADEVC